MCDHGSGVRCRGNGRPARPTVHSGTRLAGHSETTSLTGGGNADTLRGRSGDDALAGGAGYDALDGGSD